MSASLLSVLGYEVHCYFVKDKTEILGYFLVVFYLRRNNNRGPESETEAKDGPLPQRGQLVLLPQKEQMMLSQLTER